MTNNIDPNGPFELTYQDVHDSGYDPQIEKMYWFQERDKLLRQQLTPNPYARSLEETMRQIFEDLKNQDLDKDN